MSESIIQEFDLEQLTAFISESKKPLNLYVSLSTDIFNHNIWKRVFLEISTLEAIRIFKVHKANLFSVTETDALIFIEIKKFD